MDVCAVGRQSRAGPGQELRPHHRPARHTGAVRLPLADQRTRRRRQRHRRVRSGRAGFDHPASRHEVVGLLGLARVRSSPFGSRSRHESARRQQVEPGERDSTLWEAAFISRTQSPPLEFLIAWSSPKRPSPGQNRVRASVSLLTLIRRRPARPAGRIHPATKGRPGGRIQNQVDGVR